MDEIERLKNLTDWLERDGTGAEADAVRWAIAEVGRLKAELATANDTNSKTWEQYQKAEVDLGRLMTELAAAREAMRLATQALGGEALPGLIALHTAANDYLDRLHVRDSLVAELTALEAQFARCELGSPIGPSDWRRHNEAELALSAALAKMRTACDSVHNGEPFPAISGATQACAPESPPALARDDLGRIVRKAFRDACLEITGQPSLLPTWDEAQKRGHRCDREACEMDCRIADAVIAAVKPLKATFGTLTTVGTTGSGKPCPDCGATHTFEMAAQPKHSRCMACGNAWEEHP